MHYIPKYFNDNDYFKRLNFIGNNRHIFIKNKISLDIVTEFLHRASISLYGIEKCILSCQETTGILLNFSKQFDYDNDNKVFLSSNVIYEFYAQIPQILSSIVMMQNILPRLISNLTGQGHYKNISTSFRKVIKSLENDDHEFEENIKNQLLNYWNEYGSYVRDVRNIIEHHSGLINNTYFYFEAEKGGKVVVLFPDNPHVKSFSQFKFEKQKDAIGVMVSNMLEINKIIDDCCKSIGLEKKDFGAGIINLNTFQPEEMTLDSVTLGVRMYFEKEKKELNLSQIKYNKLKNQLDHIDPMKYTDKQLQNQNLPSK